MPNQVIKNPWEDLLLELVKKSKSSIRITSPFIKASSTKKLLKAKKDSAKLSLISSFKLMSFHLKVSDFAAIESIIRTSGVVKNNHYLHAKKYIFDNSKVVVTSANLTESGLKRNYEYGVLIDEKRLVKKIVEDYERLFHHKDTGDIDLEKISVAKSILMKIPKTKRLTLPKIDNISESEEISVYTGGIETIRNTLSGWRLATFDCLIKIKRDEFHSRDVYRFKPDLSRQFPENKNIEAKLRQQLQELRDIGLVEFLGSGKYRKLWMEDLK